MKILHLITARGGSKGIPGKNLRKIADISLLGYKAISAQKSKYCSRLIVSTDSKDIQENARQYDVEVPFDRPAELATDTSSSMDVIQHAMDFIEHEDLASYDAVMLLEPSSPFATHVDLDRAVEMMVRQDAPVVVGVKPVDIHSSKHGILDEQSRIHRPIDRQEVAYRRRQDDEQEYILNGALYLFQWEFFKRHGRILADPDQIYAYVMEPAYSIEIDHPIDLVWAEFLVEKNEVELAYWQD